MPTETQSNSARRVRESLESSREVVQDHPLPAALTLFGIGFGVGLVLGVMLSESEPAPANRWEGLSRQISDAVSRAVPDAIARRMG